MRVWLSIGLAAMLVLGTFSIALRPASATFATPKNLSQTSTDSNLAPIKGNQIAVSGYNVYAVWEDGSSDIYFARSTDGGAHFSNPANISNDADGSQSPQIVASGSSVYVIWLAKPAPSRTELAFSVSSDSGGRFSAPVLLSGASIDVSNPRIAATGSSVSVIWQDLIAGNPEIMYVSSSNGGASFGSALNLSNDSDTSFFPSVAVSGSNVYVAWSTSGGPNTSILFTLSTDGGASFGTPSNLGNNDGVSEGPELAASGNNVYVTWLDLATTTIDPFVRFSSNGASSFSSAVNLGSHTGNATNVVINVLFNTAFIAWSDNSSGNQDITAATSKDGFVSWNAYAVSSTPDTSVLPAIGIIGSKAYFFWQECNGSSVCDIYYRSGSYASSAITFDTPSPINLTNDPDDSFHPHVAASSIGVNVIWDSAVSLGASPEVMYSREPANGPALADAGPSPINSVEGATVTLNGTATFDAENDPITYSWMQTLGPSVTLSGANTATPSFIAPDVSSTTTLQFQLTASASGGSTQDTVDVLVNDMAGIVNISNTAVASELPSIAASGNNVFVAWEEGPSGNQDIFLAKSTDGGATFGTPINISNNRGDSNVPTVSAVGNNIYIVWSDFTSGNYEILFKRSTDGGATFGSEINLSGNAGNSTVPHMAATGNGVYVTWQDNTPGNFEIFLSKSTDNGATFGAAANISSNGGNSSEPIVAAAGSNIYLAWYDDTPGNFEIFLSKSTDNGATFGSAVNLSNNSLDSIAPWISATNSNVYVAWYDHTPNNDEISFVKSTDNGATFGSTTTLSTITHDALRPFVYSSQGNVLVVWSESSPTDIILRYSVDNGSTFGTPLNISNNSGESWNPQVVGLGTDAIPTWFDESPGNSEIFAKKLGGILPASLTRTISDSLSVTDVLDRGGTLTIKKVSSADNNQLLPGAKFTITPNPFTMTSSLTIQDGDSADPDHAADGIIKLKNVGVGTYTIDETQTPAGFDRIGQTVTTSVHRTQPDPTVIIKNKPTAQPVTQPIDVPSPDLSNTQFNTFVLKGAKVDGVPVDAVSDLPDASLAPVNQVPSLPTVSFVTAAPRASTTTQLHTDFTIPTYTVPETTIATNNVYAVPPILIDQVESPNKFLLTPIVEKTIPAMTLKVNRDVPVAAGNAKVEAIAMTFSNQVSASNIGFSFDIADTPPPLTPTPPTALSETTPLFITVGFVGDFTGINFSSTAAFQASPTVKILISRSIDTAKLADGCPDLNLLFFNESTNQWESVTKPTRDASQDNSGFCGYELKPGHWSKFAVGGVRVAVNVLQSIIPSSGGGGSSIFSTSASGNVNSGAGASSTVSVGGNNISVNFDNVISAGQISASKISPTRISSLFKSISVNSATLSVDTDGQRGLQYSVAGDIFDIDASAVNYKGFIQLSIPYDPSWLPAGVEESEMRFLHHTANGWEDATVSVDTVAKTIKGKVGSLSPVVAGYIDDGTFSDAYLAKHPLQKITVSNVSADVKHKSGGFVQFVVSTTVKSAQRTSQNYYVIIQALDADGFTEGIRWSTGTIERGATANVSSSLVLKGSEHQIQVFVWDDISKNPVPLSNIFTRSLH